MSKQLPTINFINFNQTGTCISVATSRGFKIFNCDPFGKFYSEENGSYSIVEMLFSTSLLALVGSGDQPAFSPRRLQIINTKKHSMICEVTFPTSILSVKMNKSRLAVVLQERIYIYDISNMRLLHTLETHSNPEGLVTMSPCLERNYLAYPLHPQIIDSEIKTNATTNNIAIATGGRNVQGNYVLPNAKNPDDAVDDEDDNDDDDNNNNNNNNNTKDQIRQGQSVRRSSTNEEDMNEQRVHGNNISKNGDIIIFNLTTLQPLMVIEAHQGDIAALQISSDGTLLATASEKGTIIRVFNVETGVKLYQFRRGTYPTTIYSMCFDENNDFLAVTCSSKTVHVFKLGAKNILTSDKNEEDSNIEVEEDEIRNEVAENDDGDGTLGLDEDRVSLETLEDLNQIEPSRSKEPFVDASRKTMGRMIRNSSQKLSRRAAKTLGQIFPIKVTSILEPSRHFASLKLPIESSSNIKSITSIGSPIDIDLLDYPELFDQDNDITERKTSQTQLKVKMIPIRVISSEGSLYNYVLDPERGGDCLLLSQYSLLLA